MFRKPKMSLSNFRRMIYHDMEGNIKRKDFIKKRIEEFCEYDQITINELEKRIKATKRLEEMWYSKIGNDELWEKAYRTEIEKYVDWDWYFTHSEHVYRVALDFLNEKKVKGKMVDFGGGNGDLSIISKNIGYDVYYVNLPGDKFKFAKWRFKKRNLDIPTLKRLTNKVKFNIFMTFEVAEHFWNPEVFRNIILKSLNFNGYLIETTSFSFRTFGHFDEYKFGNEIVNNSRASRYFTALLRQNFELIEKAYNARPRIWKYVRR